MEKKQKFEVVVKHVNEFSRKFVIEANSEIAARQTVLMYITDLPIDARRGTFDGSHISFEIGDESYFMYPASDAKPPKNRFVIDEQIDKLSLNEIDVQKAIGETTKHLRASMGMGLRDLARRAGMAPQSIWALEQADNGVRLFNVIKIALAFGKSPDDFLRIALNERGLLTGTG